MPEHKTLDFLDGTKFLVEKDTCRGCFMRDREADLPPILAPIIDDGVITARQDAEWPVPGFLVVGIRPHIGTIADLDLDIVRRLGMVLHFVRRAMRDLLGLSCVQMYQEEKLVNAHFHIWLLPLWPSVMDRYQINPRLYEGNVRRYLELFDFAVEESRVRACVESIGASLRRVKPLRDEGLFSWLEGGHEGQPHTGARRA